MESKKLRKVRHKRVRRKVQGTKEKPRLCVFRSNKHIYAYLIDDLKHNTLAAASTLGKEFDKKVKTSTKQASLLVGELIAKKAKDKGIQEVCFDRGGYKYHGKVKELSEGARKGGLKF